MIPPASSLMDAVDEMLLDAGQEQDTQLRAALLSLGSLASLPAPAPNARLAALLASRSDELSRRRRLRRHRPAIVGLAVVAGMGLGVTGVAASASGPAENAGLSVQHLLKHWAPSWSVYALPAAVPGVVPEPSPERREAAPDQPAAPDNATGETSGTQTDDGGAGHRGASGSAATDSRSSGSPEPTRLPDSAREPARQAQEKAEKLPAGVVPEHAVPGGPGNGSAGHAGAGKKADPGAPWLKKFSR